MEFLASHLDDIVFLTSLATAVKLRSFQGHLSSCLYNILEPDWRSVTVISQGHNLKLFCFVQHTLSPKGLATAVKFLFFNSTFRHIP